MKSKECDLFMKNVAMRFMMMCLFLVCACCKERTDLESEIDKLTDSWGPGSRIGASADKWSVIDRIGEMTNTTEKVRLVRKAVDRFLAMHEKCVIHCDSESVYLARECFIRSCYDILVRDKERRPDIIIEGWEMVSKWLDVVEGIRDSMKDGKVLSKEQIDLVGYSERQYFLYFRYTFATAIYGSLICIPEKSRGSMVKLIRERFINRRGIEYVRKEDMELLMKLL